ncbi:short-chain dehydrogenase/reductase SDR [Rhodococcus opacus PD630]|nr:short-chain dehydrogenase/reductase SDR [Rhodococcus opacus PD630]
MAAELAEDGGAIGATVLCPGPVRSNIKPSLRSMHQGERGGLFDDGPVASMRWMEPIECGRLVDDGIRANDLYVITHPELWPMVQPRLERTGTAFTASAPAYH